MSLLLQVMEAYRTGVTVLGSLRKEQGLQVEKVEGVMDDLKEARSSKLAPDVAQCLSFDVVGHWLIVCACVCAQVPH